ncbi:MAG: heparinase II/III family protein, partial [Candidatus Hydrogenedentes bacterium]|nr:heparinase II/III family protein [Candidatus Hydrogenedentota bacterium]
RAKLDALLETEIAGVDDDWQARRPWFVSSNNPVTNQWVLPSEGLVRACLILRARTRGVDTHRDAYELGVKNLLAALDAHGQAGEFEEGFGYASFTVTSLLHAAHAMAVAGDRRAIDHPFLRHFATWLVHHFQPGNMAINCFDAGGAFDAAKSTRPLLSLLAVCTNDPVARWALSFQAGGPSNDLGGLAGRSLEPVGVDAAPPLYAAYERAARVNWRDSWDDNATGVWVRGGHPLDQHDHQDRGHVNFICKGKPILIEAGTPSYDHPLMMTQYTPGVGHNVLQLGAAAPADSANAGELVWMPGWQKAGGVAPISVNRLDASGGDITVDATKCYDGVQLWRRRVTWDANSLAVSDEVQLAPDASDVILLRWHLGTNEDVAIREEAGEYALEFSGLRISIEPSAPVVVSQIKLPDHTLEGHTGDDDPGNVHTCIVVRTREKIGSFTCSLRAVPAG